MGYVEVESTSWFSRLMKSVVGVLVGIVLFFVSFPLLFWNEGRAVKTAEGLTEGAANTVPVADPSKVDPANDGKLVHFSGKAETKDVLKDEQFGIEEPAIRLSRSVEMYQWKQDEKKETRKKLGGGTETITTYTYNPAWSKTWIDSSKFKEPEGHQNPPSIPFEQKTFSATDVKVGAYRLPGDLAKKIAGDEKLAMKPATLEKVPSELKSKFKITDGDLYEASNPESGGLTPAVGDVRIQFTFVKPGPEVSVVSRQTKETLEPYTTATGTTIDFLMMGTLSATAMFEQKQAENTTKTWILRVVGLVLMAFGIGLCFQPLAVMADVIPIIGDFVGAGIFLCAVGVAIPLTLITIALGWVTYRPLVGIPLLVVAVLGLVGLFMIGRARKAAKPAVAGAK